jgi:hypothetical protein
MWSGPRNISTAMMRSWENRPDCEVIDEPLYAHYLQHTGDPHPGADEVIARGDTDWHRVTAQLAAPHPSGCAIWFQKHMCQHLLPHIEREWIYSLTNVLLIRPPEQVVASYLRTRGTVSALEIGMPQQAELFDLLSERNGEPPIVIDAPRFLADPGAQLRTLCERLQIPWTDRMLSWPTGPRDSDGIWARHWYHAVWASTAFEPPTPRPQVPMSDDAQAVVDQCQPLYQRLQAHRLQSE